MAKACLRTIETDLRIRVRRAEAEIERLNARIDASQKYVTQRNAMEDERSKLLAMISVETGTGRVVATLFDAERHMDAGAQILADNETGEATDGA